MTRAKRITAATLIASAIAIPAEGLRQYAYYDPPGILTVCYGSTTNVEKGKKIAMYVCQPAFKMFPCGIGINPLLLSGCKIP